MSDSAQREWRFYIDSIIGSDIPTLLPQLIALGGKLR